MTITIEEGKFYRTSAGGVVGPMKINGRGLFHAGDPTRRIWHRDGSRLSGVREDTLVAEWVDEQEEPAREFDEDFIARILNAKPHTTVDVPADMSGADGCRHLQEAQRRFSLANKAAKAPSAEPVTKRAVLEKATEAVADRGLNYGRPEDNFDRIARRWNVHVLNRYGAGAPQLDAIDVALMMDDVKSARLENSPHHVDSWIDKAGYAACGGEIAGRDKTA